MGKQSSKERDARHKRAIQAGVRIALGTDFVGWAPEKSAREFELMHALGLSAMQCIKAGTSVAAEMIGGQLGKDVGCVQAGRFADLVAVEFDPTQKVHVESEGKETKQTTDKPADSKSKRGGLAELQRVRFVMLGGKIVRNDWATSDAQRGCLDCRA